MFSINFVRSENEYCIYIKATESSKIFILLHVDDLLLAGDNELEISKIKLILNEKFKVKDLGHITQNLCQRLQNKRTYLEIC